MSVASTFVDGPSNYNVFRGAESMMYSKSELLLPVDFLEGSTVNITMVEDFSYGVISNNGSG